LRPEVFVNRIATAVPENECHAEFEKLAPRMISDPRKRRLFRRLMAKSAIESRYTHLQPVADPNRIDAQDFYRWDRFPTTAERMQAYEANAYRLAEVALNRLDLAQQKEAVTHLVVASCTGFYAPGLDVEIMKRFGMNGDVERTFIGFMGCFAGINALKTAYHIVRSQPDAKVLTVNLELCTLHFQHTEDLEQLLSFVIFGDGCAAAFVSAEEVGLRLLDFHSGITPETEDLITWRIGNQGFDMHLSIAVPRAVEKALSTLRSELVPDHRSMTHWAIHPGGKAILDAVEKALQIPEAGMRHSREILRRYGNMSSSTVLFVLESILKSAAPPGVGLAVALGPGVTVESMRFELPTRERGDSGPSFKNRVA
jgi:predicted naringenin-chalcone synthase